MLMSLVQVLPQLDLVIQTGLAPKLTELLHLGIALALQVKQYPGSPKRS